MNDVYEIDICISPRDADYLHRNLNANRQSLREERLRAEGPLAQVIDESLERIDQLQKKIATGRPRLAQPLQAVTVGV